MSISYQTITQRHNDNLECFSRYGTGTVFVIIIPVYQKKSNIQNLTKP
jgi:signal transduction histidine kinase